MISSDSFLAKLLISFSWPKTATKRKRSAVTVDRYSILSRLLQAISYSEHGVKKINKETEINKISAKLEKLWGIVQLTMKQRKFIRAENALLRIIQIDKYNAAAYNRLGILYAKSREFDESIRCFRLATKLEPAAASYHNLALINYETGRYKTALKHFRSALKYDDSLASRYIAIAKVYEKLGDEKQVLHNLRIAAQVEPSKQTKRLLYTAYRAYGYDKKASEVEQQMLESLDQDVKEVKELEHATTTDQGIFPSNTTAGYQY